jgi:hypothetical protein
MYQVQMQFIPGNNMVWVAKLHPTDPIYEYNTLAEAEAQATTMQNADATGRKYKTVKLS